MQQGSIAYDGSSSQVDLRLSGLVVEQQNRLEAYNPIYRQVFDESWVAQAFTKMRPYAAAIEAWEASGRTDETHLLTGKALDKTLAWAESRTLGRADYQFLVDSQKLSLRQELAATTQELAARTSALERVNEELAQSQRSLVRNQRRTGWLVGLGAAALGLSLVGAGIATHRAGEATAQESEAKEEAQAANLDRRLSIIPRVGDGLGVVSLQFEKQGLVAQREALASQNSDLEAANQQASQQVETAEAASRNALARFDQVNGQLGEVQGDLDAKTTELDTKIDELAAKNQELGDLTGEVTQLETEKDDLEQAQVQITQALQQTIGTLGIQRVRNVYYVLGGFDNALDYLNGSLEQAKTIQDRRGEGYANGNLGTMYATLGQYPQALAHHEAHLKIGRAHV